jgi:hypothetical protein
VADDEGLGTYVAERYWPGVTTEILTAALVRVTAAAESQSRGGSIVRHMQSTLVPVEEVVFCLFEASSCEAVEEANRVADVSFDHVAEAVLICDSRGSG